MLARINKMREEEGFTLIELLVVMIIIGILAAIAIPLFLNQKKKAHETAAKSDATNIAKEMAAFSVDANPATVTWNGAAAAVTGPLPVTLAVTYTSGSPDSTTVKLGANDILKKITVDGNGGYCVEVDSTDTSAAKWSATQDGLTRGGTC